MGGCEAVTPDEEVPTTVASYKNFVGGDWVDAVDGETMEVLNPATGDYTRVKHVAVKLV